MSVSRETIYALASGRPPCAVAVVRISGPQAGEAARHLCGAELLPRHVHLRRLQSAAGDVIDEALVLWFPAPRSETGEDNLELQVHGSEAVLRALFEALATIPGLRPAEPGEFTRRAFENGKLDLAQAEGLLDLVHATTEGQRQAAFHQYGGALSRRAGEWREALVGISARLMASLEFSDEDDVPFILAEEAAAAIGLLRDDMKRVLAEARRGERMREGFRVAIVGPPNAGKSALANHLAGRDVAIVSPHAGTTRDVIEVTLDLGGWPVVLFDTAGLRDSDDPVEREGVRRALARAAEADLVLAVRDASAKGGVPAVVPVFNGPMISVANKADLFDSGTIRLAGDEIAVSATTGTGIPELIERIGATAGAFFASDEPALVSRERHRAAIGRAVDALARAAEIDAPELVAEELRVAADAVGRIAGRIDVENMLDRVFAEFCIGK